MARENIEAGSGLAQALAGFSKAVGDTRVQNAQNVSLGLQNMLNAMYRHSQDVKAQEQQRIDNNYREMSFAFQKANEQEKLKLQQEQQKIAQNQWLLDHNLRKQEQKHQAALVGAKASLLQEQARALRSDNESHQKLINEYEAYKASTPPNASNSEIQQLNVFDENYNVTQNAPSDTKSNTQDSQVSKTFMRANYEIQQKKKENQKQQDSQVSKNPLLPAISQAVVPSVTAASKPNILFSSKGKVQQDLPSPQNLAPQNLPSPQNQQTKKKTWGEFLAQKAQKGEPLSKQAQQDLAQYLAQNPIFNANVRSSTTNKETLSMQEMEQFFHSTEQVLKYLKQNSGLSQGILRWIDTNFGGFAYNLPWQKQAWASHARVFTNTLGKMMYGNQLSKQKQEDINNAFGLADRGADIENNLQRIIEGLEKGIIAFEESARFAQAKGFPVDRVERQRYENAIRNLEYLKSIQGNPKLFDPTKLAATPIFRAKVD